MNNEEIKQLVLNSRKVYGIYTFKIFCALSNKPSGSKRKSFLINFNQVYSYGKKIVFFKEEVGSDGQKYFQILINSKPIEKKFLKSLKRSSFLDNWFFSILFFWV